MNLNKKTTTAGETVSISYRHGEADFSDLVHVVRCKDCKYWDRLSTGNVRECVLIEGPSEWKGDDYCSYGEMEEEWEEE